MSDYRESELCNRCNGYVRKCGCETGKTTRQDTTFLMEFMRAENLLKRVFLLLNDDFIQEDKKQKEFKKLEKDIGEFLE